MLGTAVIWLTLPAIGAVIFGETTKAVLCGAGAVVAAVAMFKLTGPALAKPVQAG